MSHSRQRSGAQLKLSRGAPRRAGDSAAPASQAAQDGGPGSDASVLLWDEVRPAEAANRSPDKPREGAPDKAAH